MARGEVGCKRKDGTQIAHINSIATYIGVLSQSFEIHVKSAGADLSLENPIAVLTDLVERLDQATDLIVLLARANLAESKGLASAFGDSD